MFRDMELKKQLTTYFNIVEHNKSYDYGRLTLQDKNGFKVSLNAKEVIIVDTQIIVAVDLARNYPEYEEDLKFIVIDIKDYGFIQKGSSVEGSIIFKHLIYSSDDVKAKEGFNKISLYNMDKKNFLRYKDKTLLPLDEEAKDLIIIKGPKGNDIPGNEAFEKGKLESTYLNSDLDPSTPGTVSTAQTIEVGILQRFQKPETKQDNISTKTPEILDIEHESIIIDDSKIDKIEQDLVNPENTNLESLSTFQEILDNIGSLAAVVVQLFNS